MALPLWRKGNLFDAYDKKIDTDDTPIDYITSWIRRRMVEFGNHPSKPNDIINNRVLIINAKTGAGKSTAMIVSLMRIFHNIKMPTDAAYTGFTVICTQPRVLTAIEISKGIAAAKYNPDMELGKTMGYQTGAFTLMPKYGLIFATMGVLNVQLRTMTDEQIMNRYKIIVVDEVHERSLEADTSIALLRQFYHRNKNNEKMPFLILTSATFDTIGMAAYFGVSRENIFMIQGSTFPITDNFPENGTNDYISAAVETCVKIHKEHADDDPVLRDVLIFVPGSAEGTKLKQRLTSYLPDCIILFIDSKSVNNSGRDYMMINVPLAQCPGHPTRRIILTTAVAETGLTIETLKYVIDSGWARVKECFFPRGECAIESLLTKPVTESRRLQRKGRVGRKFPGEYYPLYTKNIVDILEKQQQPDLVVKGCHDILLVMLKMCDYDTTRIPELFISPPPAESLLWSLRQAMILGIINEKNRLTALGQIISRCARMSMERAKIIICAAPLYGISPLHAATLAAIAEISKRDLLGRKAEANLNDHIQAFHLINSYLDAFITGRGDDIKIKDKVAESVLVTREDIINDGINMGIDMFAGDLLPLPTDAQLAQLLMEGYRGRILIGAGKKWAAGPVGLHVPMTEPHAGRIICPQISLQIMGERYKVMPDMLTYIDEMSL